MNTTTLNLTLPWSIQSVGRRTTGHGESVPEVRLGRGTNGLIDITLSSYYGTEEQVRAAANDLLAILNAHLEVTYVR